MGWGWETKRPFKFNAQSSIEGYGFFKWPSETITFDKHDKQVSGNDA